MGVSLGKGGLLDSLSSSPLHIVMLGLDSAGKTTALYRLKFDQYLNTVPTIGFNCERIKATGGKCKGTSFLVWDVGGQEKLRPLWRSYTRATDGIVFVIDSADCERMEEARVELLRTVRYPEHSGVPLLVLANKQDLPGARDATQVEKALGLQDKNALASSYHVQPACAIIGEGLSEGLDVLHDMICRRKRASRLCPRSSRRR